MIREADVLAALPPHGFIRSYVEYAMHRTDANCAYHLASAISILTQTVPLDYCVPYASPLFGNMFTLIVGDSSKSRKTASINTAQRILREALPDSVGEVPGSQEGLYESVRSQQRQLVIYGEFGEFLAKAEEGYMMALKTAYTNLWDCLDSETDILTPKGWKSREDLVIGDPIYAMNPETGKLEIVPILDIGDRPVRKGEKMFVLKGQRSDIRTTEGHRLYFKYRQAGKVSKKFIVKTGKEFAERKGEYLLPLAALPETNFPGVPLTDDELRFVAWFLTDGCQSTPQKVVITQSKEPMVEEIRTLLLRLGYDFRERVVKPGAGSYPNSKPRHEFTIPKGTGSGSKKRNGWVKLAPYLDKTVPEHLDTMTREQFRLFWAELLKGDGDNTGRQSDGLYCNLKEQADRYTAMAAARGFATGYSTRKTKNGVTMYRVTARDTGWLHSNPSMSMAQKPELVDPRPGETVWCVTNSLGTLVTRRNGKVAIIGNCIPIGRALAHKRQGAVQDPRVSLLCGVATDLLERHTEQADWTGGFLARFLTFFAEPEREFPSPPTDDPTTRRKIVQWVVDLANPPSPPGLCLWLDAAGQQTWNDWYESMRPLREGANRRVAAACSRATAIAAKLALLIAWDVGQARSGQDWYIGQIELESALKITSLHLASVIELGDRVTGSRDMRDRRAVLRAIGEGKTPFGVVIRESELLKRRVREILDSLLEERMIQCERVNGEDCYFYTPHLHQRLLQMAYTNTVPGIGSGAPQGQVLALRPPPVTVTPLRPQADVLNEEDDIDWATFNG